MHSRSAAVSLAFLVVLFGCRNAPPAKQHNEPRGEQGSDTSIVPAATVGSISRWKLYEQPSYGFRFNYPANWFVHEEQHSWETDDTVACDSITVRVSNFEWRPGPRPFPTDDSTLVFITAIKGCPDLLVRKAFEQQDKNAELGGEPAVEIITKQELMDAGPLAREESGITLQSFKSDTEYLVGIRPLDTPFGTTLQRVFSSFEFID